MADTRTGPAVQKLVEAVQEDVGDALDNIERGLGKLREIQEHARGINGFGSTLKAKGDEIGLACKVIREEAEGVAKKMLREPRAEPIVQHVDKEQVARVRAAKAVE